MIIKLCIIYILLIGKTFEVRRDESDSGKIAYQINSQDNEVESSSSSSSSSLKKMNNWDVIDGLYYDDNKYPYRQVIID
jgi:hypothetical protein